MRVRIISGAFLALMLLLISSIVACTKPAEDGKEPVAENKKESKAGEIPHYMKIKKVEIGEIDATLAKAGKESFEMKCSACHKLDERYVGPALREVTVRRTPEYIMNMILDTETMIENDDTVKCLLQTYLSKMPNQSLDEKEARSVLEHLRVVATEKK